VTGDKALFTQFEEMYQFTQRAYTNDWHRNPFNDDIMWLTIALTRAYLYTGERKYLDTAKLNFDKTYERAASEDLGGGLFWRVENQCKNTCVNCPGAVAAMYLLKATGDESYADKAAYCSAGINLLGGVVRHATGRRLTELFRDWIAGPMQMRGYHLNLMPDDDAYLAGGIQLRPRDLLKLGQVYLDGGTWHGKRLVRSSWIEASVARHTTFGPNHDYGYAWHLHTYRVQDHDYRAYAAEGNGGQFVIVVPELDLVVAIAAGSYGEFSTWYALQDLVTDYIIPAALPAAR
jgi:hypothetical protein